MNPSPRATALIFDGDPLSLTAIAATLHASNYECLCARTAAAAKKAVSDEKIDLLVLDIGKEVQEGLQLWESLQALLQQGSLPTIFLSQPAQVATLRSAVSGPAVYHLTKPYDPRALIDLAAHSHWMPHLVSHHRKRHPTQQDRPGWISL